MRNCESDRRWQSMQPPWQGTQTWLYQSHYCGGCWTANPRAQHWRHKWFFCPRFIFSVILPAHHLMGLHWTYKKIKCYGSQVVRKGPIWDDLKICRGAFDCQNNYKREVLHTFIGQGQGCWMSYNAQAFPNDKDPSYIHVLMTFKWSTAHSYRWTSSYFSVQNLLPCDM